MDIRWLLVQWYQQVLDAGGRITQDLPGMPKVEISITELVSPKYTRIYLSPFSVGGEKLFHYVLEDIFPNGQVEFRQSKEFATWSPVERPVYHEVLMAAYQMNDWTLVGVSPGRDLERYEAVITGGLFERLEREVDPVMGTTSVWLNIPTLIPIESSQGRIQVNTVLQFGHVYVGENPQPMLNKVRFRKFVY